MYSCDEKGKWLHDPSEIILKYWFVAWNFHQIVYLVENIMKIKEKY